MQAGRTKAEWSERAHDFVPSRWTVGYVWVWRHDANPGLRSTDDMAWQDGSGSRERNRTLRGRRRGTDVAFSSGKERQQHWQLDPKSDGDTGASAQRVEGKGRGGWRK